MSADLIPLDSIEYQDLNARKLTEDSCRAWGYGVSTFKGQKVQVANYRSTDGTRVVAQKVRFANKDFVFLGDTKEAGLYGQHLWRDGGKMVVVTEGEIDAISVSQIQNHKWPVVSIPNGANGAKKSISKNLEWLEKFDSVIFMFDMDEPGQEAARECANLLTPGKSKIASMKLKDANELLKAGRGPEIIDAMWGAKVYRPDGIINASDLWGEIIKQDDTDSRPYPWGGLNNLTLGCRRGELVTFTAGTGVGKSSSCREIAYDFLTHGENVGYIALEESTKRTALGIMGLHLNRPLHISREGVSEAEMRAAFDATAGSGRLCLYDHFGSTNADNLISKIRYMVKGIGATTIFLDHLSIIVSGDAENDERKIIDSTMTKLRTLVEEVRCRMILVSHLKRPEGKGHEEGAQTSLSQLRGSAAIGQLSDIVIGAERNQQADDPNVTALRVLKNRFTGETGIACYLRYDRATGRLTETNPCFDEAPKPAEANTDF